MSTSTNLHLSELPTDIPVKSMVDRNGRLVASPSSVHALQDDMSTSQLLPDFATPAYDPLLPLAASITTIGTLSRATQLGLLATTTVTETTTVFQLVYFREPATTASSSHNSTASNVQQALEKVAGQYEGSTLAELGRRISRCDGDTAF